EDLPDIIPDYVTVLFSEKGSCVQRNCGIDHCQDESDAIVFIDDDTFLHPTFICELERLFAENPEFAALKGILIKDGGITVDEAMELLESHTPEKAEVLKSASLYGGYAIRTSMLDGLRYDERLVLYGWLEDADLAANLRKKGSIGCSRSLVGVHLMFSSGGRSNHVRFGFSQIMNPFYLSKKNRDVFSFQSVFRDHWFKAVGANVRGMIIERDRKMRWDRFKGNVIAFGMLLSGRVEPEYAGKL
ncbi:glycosyltransferase, partial [Pontiella sp.]|uniref:glycosyltransferase n=1 Tax=Pontiella sp. TaxID=2837462 RepID=UPI003568FB59